jgi:periplasmic protein TonB
MNRLRVLCGGTAALALSGALHAAGLLIVVPQDEPVLVDGGGMAEIAALGVAFEDFVVGSLPVTPAAQPAVQASVTSPAVVVPASEVADLAQPVAAVTPATPVTVTATPVTPDTTTAMADDKAPVSSIRPVARPAPRPQRSAQPTPAAPAGNAETDANRGSAQGQTDGQATAVGTAAQENTGGQAAAANYPGQVLRQITRLRRQSAPSRGTVTVSFAIAGSGALADVAILQSSGSPALDQMALDHIRRAAPFPPPPAGAQTVFSFAFEGRP